jgi:hypothetical protein
MRLNCVHVSCLRQNLNQIVVGQEIKSWEGSSLGSEVILKSFLNLLKFLIILLELL